MVPSASDVLTWILLSDHFISPREVTVPPHQTPRLPVVSSDDEREPSAVLLLPDEREGDMRNCLPVP